MNRIKGVDRKIMEACRLYVDNLIKPIHSLGQLEDMAIQLSGILGTERPQELKKAVVIMAGDTAVDRENKTNGKLSMAELTMVSKGLAPVSAAARMIDAPVYIVDLGLEQETENVEGVLTKKVTHGTHQGHPAMEEGAAASAISLGMSIGKTLSGQGIQAVGLGNIGERSMLSALAVTAAVMKKELQENSMKQGFSINLGTINDIKVDPIGVLAAVGSAEIAGLFGLVVQAAREGMAVVFDNAVTGAAVLAAVAVYPEVKDYVFPSVYYEEPIHQMQMKKLEMKSFLHYDFTLAQGVGSVMGLSLLDASLDMLNVMKTFGQGGVDVAEDGPGKARQRGDVQ